MANVVAINVLIEPDSRVAEAARRANQRVHTGNLQGFTFDSTHVPHISLLHRYVRQSDLPRIYAAVDRVIADLRPQTLALTATGYDTSPWEGGSLVNITVKKVGELNRMQEALVSALMPYTVATADEHAFARTADSKHIDMMTIDYVATFVPEQVGASFKPHITVGLGDRDAAKRLQAEPFAPISFRPAAIAVYQLGNLGTARRKLHESANK
jgi:hypothetical protein